MRPAFVTPQGEFMDTDKPEGAPRTEVGHEGPTPMQDLIEQAQREAVKQSTNT